MAHYVHPQLWDDWKFLSFDDATRNLWLMLLTGPFRKALPGLFRASVDELASALKRPRQLVDNSMILLENEGMVEHDRVARVVCLPNATRYAFAPNPNQLASWFAQWREVPTCELKFAYIPRLERLVKPKSARKSVLAMWKKTFGDVRSGEPVRYDHVGRESPPHTPPLDLDLDLDLDLRVKREAIHMAPSESKNVRKKERNDSGNSEHTRTTHMMRTSPSKPASGPDERVDSSVISSTSTLSEKLVDRTNSKSGASDETAPEHGLDDSCPNPANCKNQQVQEHTEIQLDINNGRSKNPSTASRDTGKVVGTQAFGRGNTKNEKSRVPECDRIPDFCLPTARRKRSQTPA